MREKFFVQGEKPRSCGLSKGAMRRFHSATMRMSTVIRYGDYPRNGVSRARRGLSAQRPRTRSL